MFNPTRAVGKRRESYKNMFATFFSVYSTQKKLGWSVDPERNPKNDQE